MSVVAQKECFLLVQGYPSNILQECRLSLSQHHICMCLSTTITDLIPSSVKYKDARMVNPDTPDAIHVYRDCEVWPYVDPGLALALSPEPITVSTAKSVFLGGSGKLYLTADLRRHTWIAGQKCFVDVCIFNDTQKTVSALPRLFSIQSITQNGDSRCRTDL